MMANVIERDAAEAGTGFVLDRTDNPRHRAIRVRLNRALKGGWLRRLDVAFAEFIGQEQPEAAPELLLAVALASHQLGRGHVCLDLEATLNDPLTTLGWTAETEAQAATLNDLRNVLAGLSLATWQAAISASPRVVEGGPLAFDGQRLYLRRYWSYEAELVAYLNRAWGTPVTEPPDPKGLRADLDRLFPDATAQTDWQKLACALAMRQRFSLITGGPGTGKTTTVVKLLALLQTRAQAEQGRTLHIRLAAPTGKAAARLNESIAGALGKLESPGVDATLRLESLGVDATLRQTIPAQAVTLHRLLGSSGRRSGFRHNATNPLPLDVLVIDEASMISLELLAATLRALPAQARLVLLGDKDQLASVEAGAVLGELCARAEAGHYRPEVADWLKAATGETLPAEFIDPDGRPLDQCVVQLRHSRRFAADSGIGRLACAVNAAAVSSAQAILSQANLDLDYLTPADVHDPNLRALMLGEGDVTRLGYVAYQDILQTQAPAAEASPEAYDAWAAAVLKAYSRFQVLAAVRSGPWGVDGLNTRITAWLARAGRIEPDSAWYLGRPVLVTRNDYTLGLMNGDIGITLYRHEAGERRLHVAFPTGEGRDIKWVRPSRLNDVETVYAMTVHKAQGSEFEHAVLVLPEADSPVLTIELLYTAITRARQRLAIVAPKAGLTLTQALGRRVRRTSGLAARLA